MNYVSQQILGAADRGGQYFVENPLTPAIPLVTTLVTELDTVATAMRGHGAIQATGFTGYRSGADGRRFAFDSILDDMRALSRIAKGLDRSVYPTMRELFRMPRSRSYVHVAAQGRAFATNATENEAVFTDRGMPAGFLAAFTAKVTAAEEAVVAVNTGVIDRAGATRGIAVKGRRIRAILRELDGILRLVLVNSPELLAAWYTARHIATRKKQGEEVPAGGGGDGSGGTALVGSGS